MIEIDKNSLLYWYPKISKLNIKMPETNIILLTEDEKKQYWVGDSCDLNRLVEKIKQFPLPMFIRTDLVSNKWMWQKSCFVENFSNLQSQLFEVICFGRIADIMGLPIEAIIVREYIPMAEAFRAFWGMPVNPERRYFIKDGEVICHHSYWIEESIKFYGEAKEPKNWKMLLNGANLERFNEVRELTKYANQVAAVMEGFWSVDFCLSKSLEWILIDMAQGEKSWHPECQVKEKYE